MSQFIRLENATILRDWVAGFGWAGPVVYILMYIAACLLMLPGFPVTLMGALAFGPIWGSVFTSIGSTLGAAAAFLAARYTARNLVENWLGENDTFQRIDRGVENQGWRMLMVTRMVPLFPFNLQNFADGLTRISLITYVLVSWVSVIPGIIAYNFMAGSVVAGEADSTRELQIWYGPMAKTFALPVKLTSSGVPSPICFLQSPEAQLHKYKPEVWGDMPAIDSSRLPGELQQKLAVIEGQSGMPSLESLAASRVPEMHAQTIEWIKEILQDEIGGR